MIREMIRIALYVLLVTFAFIAGYGWAALLWLSITIIRRWPIVVLTPIATWGIIVGVYAFTH